MSEANADTVIMLSSELIAEVMEAYFNKAMFKKKVSIVDLQPTETGYAFSLAFAQDIKKQPELDYSAVARAVTLSNGQIEYELPIKRDSKGKSARKEKVNDQS